MVIYLLDNSILVERRVLVNVMVCSKDFLVEKPVPQFYTLFDLNSSEELDGEVPDFVKKADERGVYSYQDEIAGDGRDRIVLVRFQREEDCCCPTAPGYKPLDLTWNQFNRMGRPSKIEETISYMAVK